MKCCPECFGDRGLSKEIIPGLLPEKGKCSFCGSENVQIVSPSQLAEYFELLIGAYKKDPDGKLLVQLFREDWRLFEHKKMDDPHAKELLAEILDDGEIVRETFARAGNFETDPLSEWEELRDELMYKNRFFPKGKIKERVTHLLPSLTLDSSDVPSSWFRARIQLWEKPFDAVDMGAPPRRTASHGRANPVGIPYLYLASTAPTAIAEVRPHAGELACVASFETPSDLKFVDLRSPRRTVSPFLLLDAEAIQKLRNDLPFLERLGDELTRPVVPQSAAIDYIPSQYLCEIIKDSGYMGVIYRSSVCDGINLALFNPPLATVGTVTQHRITGVSIASEPLAKAV